MHLLMKFQESVKVLIKEKVIETEIMMEKYGGEMCTKIKKQEQFKEKFRIIKCNFDHIMSILSHFIEKSPTNLVSDPIQPEKHLALKI